MPFVAMRPRDTISYYMPEDIKKVGKGGRRGKRVVAASSPSLAAHLSFSTHPLFTRLPSASTCAPALCRSSRAGGRRWRTRPGLT